MCYVYAYSDYTGVSVNLFATRLERDAAVRDLLSDDFSEDDLVPFASTATAQEAWDAYTAATACCDFRLAFGELWA